MATPGIERLKIPRLKESSSPLPDGEGRHRRIAVDALPGIEHRPKIAGPEAGLPSTGLLPLSLKLGERMHREAARTFEPELVARAGEERKERKTVSCGTVTEACSLDERARIPRQLTASDKDRIELRV